MRITLTSRISKVSREEELASERAEVTEQNGKIQTRQDVTQSAQHSSRRQILVKDTNA